MNTHTSALRSVLFFAASSLVLLPASRATTLYWGNSTTSASWNTVGNWFTDSDGTTASAAIPAFTDDLVFNIASLDSTALTVTASGTITANSLTFNDSAAMTIASSNNQGKTLDLGGGGITISSGAGAFTIGTSGNTVSTHVDASQTWTNNSASALTIRNASSGPSTGTTPVTLTIDNTSTGATQFYGINDGAAGASLAVVINSSGSGGTVFNSTGTYSGGTTIQSGILQISGNNLGTGDLTLGDASGGASAQLNIANSTTMTTNVTVASGSSGTKSIATVTGNSTVSVTGSIQLNDNLNFGTTIKSGTTALTVTGVISGTGGITLNNSLVGSGNKSLALTFGDGTDTVTETYSGNTVITSGSFTLAANAALTFYIGADGVNNSISGGGSNAAAFNGAFILDLANAALVNGNSWTIVDVGSLSESFAGTFTIQGFTQNGTVWTNGSGLSFDESTGILSYASAIPEPAVWGLLGGLAALAAAIGCRRKVRASLAA